MIGLLVVAHAPLASALGACAAHVYGSVPSQCSFLDVPPGEAPADTLEHARALVAGVDGGSGVLVLTDLFGATPANVAAELVRANHVEVVTGVNLPMLLRALTYRANCALDVLVGKASAGATAGVMKLSSTAPQNQPGPRDAGASPSTSDPNTDAQARLHHQQ